jgi:hypothetical protein
VITPADSAPTAPEQMPASSFNIQAPYAAGSPQPIAGGRDDVAGTVAAAQAAAEARAQAYQAQTYQQGSQIGDNVTLPAPSSTGPTGGDYYDPPRSY